MILTTKKERLHWSKRKVYDVSNSIKVPTNRLLIQRG